MQKHLKPWLFLVLKMLGGFHLCRWLQRRKLRILCYHGLSFADEHLLDDILFMQSATFRRRLEILRKWRMKVLPLAEAVAGLPQDRHPDHCVVITFDDGWLSSLTAASILKEFNYPSTVYVSTHYARTGTDVFNVLMRYLFWKSGKGGWADCKAILDQAQSATPAEEARIVAETGARLGIDPAPIQKRRIFHAMSFEEMRTLRGSGMSLELHTHRHRFPMERADAREEIETNRQALREVEDRPYSHFCFPSGIFEDAQLPWLADAGIQSATTTRNGFNTPQTPLLKLNRFLDRDRLSDLEFEAEICGVRELLSTLFR